MNKTLVLYLVMLCMHSNEVVQHFETLVFPNMPTAFSPFEFEAGKEQELKVNLVIKCSGGAAELGLYYVDSDICGYEFKGEKVVDVNRLLGKLSLGKSPIAQLKLNADVEYVFEVLDDKTGPQISGRVKQHFKVAEEVPISQLTTEMRLNGQESDKFEIKLLSIDPIYIRNSNIKNMNVGLASTKIPFWVRTKFQDDGLYLYGDIPEDFSDLKGLELFVIDSQTLLKSHNVEFKIINTGPGVSNKGWAILLVSLALICSLVFMLYVVIRIGVDQKKSHEAKTEARRARDKGLIISLRSAGGKPKERSVVEKDTKTTYDVDITDLKSDSSFYFTEKSKILQYGGQHIDEDELMGEIADFSDSVMNRSSVSSKTVPG